MKGVIATLMMIIALFAAEKSVHIAIDGMTCPLCTTAIKKSLKKVEGVTGVKVRLNSEDATVAGDERIQKKALLDAIERTGYKGTVLSVK